MRTTSVRLEDPAAEHMEALADKLGCEVSELIRRFVSAGLAANPVTAGDLESSRSRRAARDRGEIPGLAIPEAP